MSTISVLTYNIRHARGMDDKVNLTRIAGVLAQSEADIICLQEVDRGLPRSGMAHQAEALAHGLDFQFAYHTNFGIPVSGMGNAILSRFPIYSTWNTPLPFAGEPRGLLGAVVAPPWGKIHVYCTHWGLDREQRLRQAQAAANAMRTAKRPSSVPVIFCGDLNATPSADEVNELIHGSELMDHGPPQSLTYPTDMPHAKIDYILTSIGARVRTIEVVETDASDHLPLAASLEFGISGLSSRPCQLFDDSIKLV